MNSTELMNVPADDRRFCFVNYNAFGEVRDKNGCDHFVDLPLLKEPIIASNLEHARIKLAKILRVPVDAMTQWEEVGEDDGFTPSLSIGFETTIMTAGYSFDVYTTVNTLALLKK